MMSEGVTGQGRRVRRVFTPAPHSPPPLPQLPGEEKSRMSIRHGPELSGPHGANHSFCLSSWKLNRWNIMCVPDGFFCLWRAFVILWITFILLNGWWVNLPDVAAKPLYPLIHSKSSSPPNIMHVCMLVISQELVNWTFVVNNVENYNRY